MALSSPQLQRFLLNRTTDPNPIYRPATTTSNKKKKIIVKSRGRSRCCSAIAIDSPSFSTGVSGLRLGSTQLQGLREEMEDDVVIVSASDELDGFSFAAVFDGHAGFSSVKFLRDELYKECVRALQGGLLLSAKEFDRITNALQEAFQNADRQLINWLEETGDQVESGSTATVMFLRNEKLVIAHVGDSCVVISRSGKEEVVTNPHRPYGNNKTSLQEIKRIREAGGWINNGRICGDIAVSRAFGDMRFKTKKDEMLEKGIEEKRWSEKFVSRVRFNGDLVTATPDIYQVSLGSDAEFILLASDGLWDYVKSSEAVNLVRNQLKQHGDVQLACEALGRTALDRRSQDNISIIIADLGRTDWRKLPQQQGNFVFELSQAFATIGIVSLGVLWMSSVFSS